jgi:hypothetical protein
MARRAILYSISMSIIELNDVSKDMNLFLSMSGVAYNHGEKQPQDCIN